DDIKMMKSMGLDAYRFSISWSRILPRGRVSEGVNQKGIDYYNDLINTVIANGTSKGQIGIALNTLWCEPYKKGDADDIEAVKRAMDFVMGWFLEPVLTGVFAANDPNPTHIGYLGDQRLEISFSDATGKALGPQAGSFWLHMYPQGMYNMLIRYVNDKYGDKIPAIYITENGWDEKNDEKLKVKDACVDSMREDYHKSHLVYLLKSMKEMTVPANVKVTLHGRGVIILNGLKDTVRFGLIYIDYKNNQKRYPKTSARWFAKFLGGKEFLSANQENVEEQ
ncbi:UNVERIFIED_CONTAM: Beta-glucosidase 12, partial [Sesamum radiatum]